MIRALLFTLVCCAPLGGCVSEAMYVKAQNDLDKSKKALAQQAAALEHLKAQSDKDRQHTSENLDSVRQEKERLAADLSVALTTSSNLQRELDRLKTVAEEERQRRQQLEGEMAKLIDPRALKDENETLRQERDSLQARAEDLEQRLEVGRAEVSIAGRNLDETNHRVATLSKERDRLAQALTEARTQRRDAEERLRTEQATALEARTAADTDMRSLQREHERLQLALEQVTQDRDRLQNKVQTLQDDWQRAQRDLAARTHALDETTARLADLEREREHLTSALATTDAQAQSAQTALRTEQGTDSQARQTLQWQVGHLQGEYGQLQQRHAELRQERDHWQRKADELATDLHAAQQELLTVNHALKETTAAVEAVTHDKETLTAANDAVRLRLQELEGKLAAEQTRVAALETHAQQLTATFVTSQEEVARLEKELGRYEGTQERAEAVARQLSERDQELGALRQTAVTDRETLAGRSQELTQRVEQLSQRILDLSAELETTTDRAILAEEERDRLTAYVAQQHAQLVRAEEDLEHLRQEHTHLQTALSDADIRLHRVREERASFEASVRQREEEATRQQEEEQRRTGQIQEAFAKTFEQEIGKGDIRVQQTAEQLTVSLQDRLLFDPWQAKVKADGARVLKQISEILKAVPDRRTRVESHTVDTSTSKGRRTALWDLTAARATAVVRYLIEQGGVPRESLTAAGYGDARPLVSNDTEDGRNLNRRLDLILIPHATPLMVTDLPH